jgi:hypothetical protein
MNHIDLIFGSLALVVLGLIGIFILSLSPFWPFLHCYFFNWTC